MISAVDSSVSLDVLADDPAFAEASQHALREASSEGPLVLCECVLAEVFPALGSKPRCDEFLGDWRLEFVPSSRESAVLAGTTFARFMARGGKPGRVVADFLIAAHARHHADRLIARDRGYLRDYFKDLKVVDPARSARA